MVDPMKIECPRCHAGPDEECVTRSGAKAITMHLARIDAVEKQRSSAPPPSTPALVIKYRLPKKLPFRVRDRNHVYCDVHGTIHEAANYSQSSPCSSVDWRRVYVESSDRKEKF